MMKKNNSIYLTPTDIIDSDHPSIRAYAKQTIGGDVDPIDRAVKLYLAVRDGIRYDPYSPFYRPEHYRASAILQRGRSFCIPKASLLCALARACGIPSRIGFATVRNHLATKQLIDFMGSDIFVCHGFVELFLDSNWVKATPAFNSDLCERHHVAPLEFTGREDSLFHLYNSERQKFMEYLEYHETYADIPVDLIVSEWKRAYGPDRVDRWIQMFETRGRITLADFEREDVLNG